MNPPQRVLSSVRRLENNNHMTLESTQTTTFAVNLKTMRKDKRQLILGLPHFVSYLIAGADGAIDHWESALLMEALEDTEVISKGFSDSRATYKAELAPFIGNLKSTLVELEGGMLQQLKWVLVELEKYQQLLPLLDLGLQLNVKRYVYRVGIEVAQASDYGAAPSENGKLNISTAEDIYLALIMDAFGVHTDPDEPNSAFFR